MRFILLTSGCISSNVERMPASYAASTTCSALGLGLVCLSGLTACAPACVAERTSSQKAVTTVFASGARSAPRKAMILGSDRHLSEHSAIPAQGVQTPALWDGAKTSPAGRSDGSI